MTNKDISILYDLAHDMAHVIGYNCSWHPDFYKSKYNFIDCITSSYIFQLIAYKKYNIKTDILHGNLIGEDSINDITGGHYWNQYGNIIFDFTVSQFIEEIQNDSFLSKNIIYGDYIFNKEIFGDIYYVGNIENHRIIELNSYLKDKIPCIDFSLDNRTLIQAILDI